MKASRRIGKVLAVTIMAGLIGGCSRNPNARKQKFFESGMQYFEKGKYREAAIQLRNAIQLDSRYENAHYQLARCYLKLGLWNSAYTELVRTVDLQPANWKAQVDLGNILLAGRDFNKAREKAQLVLSKDSGNVDAHALLANANAALGNQEDSLKEMRKAIQLEPNRSQSYLNLALLQVSAKQTSGAEESYKKAISLDPKSSTPLMALGSFYAQQSRWTEAEQQFHQAVEVDPKTPQPRAALARIYIAQGEKDKAEDVLRAAKRDLEDNSEGYRMLGDFYLASGELDKALAEYSSLYQQHPKDLRVKKSYVQLLILRNRLDEASKLNEEILKENAKDIDALVSRGQIWIRQGRAKDALQPLRSVVSADRENPAAHYHLGVALAETGQPNEAESEWREAVRLRPTMVEAQRALAGVAVRKRDMDQLSKSAEALISLQPLSPLGYTYRAMAKGSRGDLAGAEADLKKAIEVAPHNPVGYTGLGELYAAKKQYVEAEKLFEQALERNPNSSESLLGLVRIYATQRQTAKAINRVNAQIEKAPGNSLYYLILGQLLIGSKDLEKAEVALQKAVDLNKNNVDAFFLLGQVQVARGSQDKAIASYQRSIQENPRDVRGYVLLGALDEVRGNWQEAQELYRKALQLEPQYALAANNLAYLMLEHGGNLDVALSFAQIARSGLPDSPNTADTLALAYYKKGVFRLASELLEEAVKKMPQNPTYHYHLGLAYQKMDDRIHAREHLQSALQLDPNHAPADEIRKTLQELAKATRASSREGAP